MVDNPFGAPEEEDVDDVLEIDGLEDVGTKFRVGVNGGFYEAIVLEAKNDISKAAKPMVTVKVGLTGRMMDKKGNIVDGDDKDSGKEFTIWLSRVTAALFKMIQWAEAIGLEITEYEKPDGSIGKAIKTRLSAWRNRRLVVQMVDSEYEGRTSSKVDKFVLHPEGWEQ